MTLKEFLLAYCPEHMISVAEVKGDGIRFRGHASWVFADEFLSNAECADLFNKEVVNIQCIRGEILQINVKGE